MSLMGIDIGTTGCRSVIFREDGLILSQAYKEYPGRAVNNFLSFLDKKLPVTRLPEIPQIPKNKKSIGKITREDDLKYYRLLYEYFTEDTSHLHPLIALKSYRLENYCYEDKSIYYILDYYGIRYLGYSEISIEDIVSGTKAHERYSKKDQELRKYFKRLNNRIIKIIQSFKKDLDVAIDHLFKDKTIPKAKMWFVDVFKKNSWRYLNNWERYERKSTNKPDFKEHFKIFKKFIIGATSTELRYGNKYHKLRYAIVPQGLICLLYSIDRLLYFSTDYENYEKNLLPEKAKEIKGILKDLSPKTANKLLSTLLRDYPNYSVELTGLLKPNIEKDLPF